MLFENEGVFLALSHGYLVNKIKRIIIIAVIKKYVKSFVTLFVLHNR